MDKPGPTESAQLTPKPFYTWLPPGGLFYWARPITSQGETMLIRNMLLKYYAPEDDGQGSGGGGTEITPEIQKLIDDQVAAQVTGLKTKNSELLGTIKQQKDNLSRYEGIDPDAVRGILQRFSDDEEAKLIAAGKIDEVLDKRTERLRADVDTVEGVAQTSEEITFTAAAGE